MEELASRNAAGGGDVAGMIQVGSSREWLDANLFGEQDRIDNILRREPRGLAELCEQVDQKAANLLNIHQANVGSHGPGPGMKKGTGTTCTSGSKPPAASSCSPQLQSPAAVPSCSPQLHPAAGGAGTKPGTSALVPRMQSHPWRRTIRLGSRSRSTTRTTARTRMSTRRSVDRGKGAGSGAAGMSGMPRPPGSSGHQSISGAARTSVTTRPHGTSGHQSISSQPEVNV